jgi:hypothetical protein
VLERIEENRVNGDKMDRYNYNKELGTSEREKERKGKRKSFSITPTLQRKVICRECRSGSFDELLSFRKEGQKKGKRRKQGFSLPYLKKKLLIYFLSTKRDR